MNGQLKNHLEEQRAKNIIDAGFVEVLKEVLKKVLKKVYMKGEEPFLTTVEYFKGKGENYRKCLFIFISLSFILFYGCSKKTIEMKITGATLFKGDSIQIEAESNTPILYQSSDNYHAIVRDNGVVVAGYVGKAAISLKNDNDEKTFNVTVTPRYNLYVEPDIKFGDSKSSILKKYGTPDIETTTGVSYNNYCLKGFYLIILFDENNNVNAYSVIVPTEYSSILGSFLGERYMFIGYQNEKLFFVNSLDIETATISIVSCLYNTSLWKVIYIPISKKGFDYNSLSDKTDRLIKLIKNVAHE